MDQKDEIKQKVDVVELISEYVQLKPAGSNSFKACCPFHTEKTPSFQVSGEKQIWKCFGCGEGGDCFEFLMKMEGLDFPEALRHLGNRVGIEVKRFTSETSNVSQRLSAMNDLASKFYQKVLLDSPAAQAARDYLTKRGIGQELRDKFGIGFAPDAWETLSTFLLKRGFSASEGVQAGLMMNRRQGSGVIDRFRNRIMISLRDAHGNTVGFTGRQMPGDEHGPKYMNSPETPIYHKGKLLFGLDLAKRAIKERGSVIIVEGNLDVVASHKAGVENVVASSGTALTQDQLTFLKRYTKTIVFSFDADAAGFNAAYKGINLARELDLDVRVVVLPKEAGKDPDEAVQKDPGIWQRAAASTKPIMQYFIDQAVAGKNLDNVDDKKAMAAFLLPELAKISDLVEREHWLQLISDLLRTDMGVLRLAVGRTPQKSVEKPVEKTQAPPAKLSKTQQAEEYIIGCFIQDQAYRSQIIKELEAEHLSSDLLKKLYKELVSLYNQPESETSLQKSFYWRVRDQLEKSADNQTLIPLLDTISLRGEQMVANLSPNEVSRQLKQLLQIIISADVKERRGDLAARIRQAESRGDQQAVQRLIAEYNEL
ncbi:DNA primase [Patescibacteria group bacterium]|nr:DNA primase [Patescibacteria group bacterium]MBU1705203.1 DNA primase [Patescibacteria group bacterium]